jgi:NAD(P)H-flavin reductase
VVELVARAPVAARKGGSGQFYRVQNFGLPQMEGLALLGVPHPGDPELLSFYVVERGASSRLVQRLQPGDPLALMGPTGAHTSRNLAPSTILVIGDIISPAFLLSMAEKFLGEGHRIWYLGYFEEARDLYCQEKLESVAEKIIWLTRQGVISAHRSQDLSFEDGDLQNALRQFPDLFSVGQVWVLGSGCLLNEISRLDPPPWPKSISVLGSVYGPMQCMLKGVCAQCLQWQIDPATGKRSKAVYACSWQHQPLAGIDIANLDERLTQNRCQETLTDLWMDYLER